MVYFEAKPYLRGGGGGGNIPVLGFVIYLALGLLQIAASVAGIKAWLGVPFIIAGIN